MQINDFNKNYQWTIKDITNKIICASSFKLHDFESSLYNGIRFGNHGLFKVFGVGHRNVDSCDSLHWAAEIVETSGLVDECDDFCTDSCEWEAVFYCNQSSSFLYTFDDRVSIERLDGSKVDDFSWNSLFLKLFGSFKRVHHISWESYKCDVCALSHDFGLSDRD